ncbi:hypothetical protein NCCP1664_25520 [Zafaria cholistanensis]|uniref:Uncharacterized protein n=1 Tax=Zafaria cholistanensis TaxID=1682741 RepID=A0A5A7NVB2_9MICC|nr:hypothetical protein [Zafaria cholistanensis]GER24057.1 hypothetical protein NCCP1664_25520 [Zafaria cholistanensis]
MKEPATQKTATTKPTTTPSAKKSAARKSAARKSAARKSWTLLVLLLCVSCAAPGIADAGSPCVVERADMPQGWRPSAEQEKKLAERPWTESEAREAAFSIRTGLREMLDFYARKPSAVEDIWEDSVASLVEVTYSSANTAELDAAASDGARRNLSRLIQPYLKRTPKSVECGEYGEILPLAVYAGSRYEDNDARTARMVKLSNAAAKRCGSLEAATGIDHGPVIAGEKPATDEEVFDLVIWSLLFIEGQLVPGLEMPPGATELPARLWEFLRTYPLPDASTYPGGAHNEDFIENAYLATHIAYIPTGNHRFPLYVQDSTALYQFHRANFYAVLEMGELDLVAEFVDSLRQYGCTPANDRQVLDGTRYLLDLFHAGGDSWMAYREPGEEDAEVESYDFIHKAWTAVLGVRERTIEPALPGTYGGIVRSWLPAPGPSAANPPGTGPSAAGAYPPGRAQAGQSP